MSGYWLPALSRNNHLFHSNSVDGLRDRRIPGGHRQGNERPALATQAAAVAQAEVEPD
jgi:hypothetical protein